MSLVETVIGVALLGLTLTVLVVGLSMGAKVAGEVAQRGTAQDMARAQLEDTKSQPYVEAPTTYPSISGYPSYSTTVVASPLGGAVDAGIQVVTVTVYVEGVRALEIQAYKVNR